MSEVMKDIITVGFVAVLLALFLLFIKVVFLGVIRDFWMLSFKIKHTLKKAGFSVEKGWGKYKVSDDSDWNWELTLRYWGDNFFSFEFSYDIPPEFQHLTDGNRPRMKYRTGGKEISDIVGKIKSEKDILYDRIERDLQRKKTERQLFDWDQVHDLREIYRKVDSSFQLVKTLPGFFDEKALLENLSDHLHERYIKKLRKRQQKELEQVKEWITIKDGLAKGYKIGALPSGEEWKCLMNPAEEAGVEFSTTADSEENAIEAFKEILEEQIENGTLPSKVA